MDYIEIYPETQNDQLTKGCAHFEAAGFNHLRLLTFFAAGMGSGKSRMMQHLRVAPITYVFAPNEEIEAQLKKGFCSEDRVLLDGMDEQAQRKTNNAIKNGKNVVVFFKHIASTGNRFGPSARKFKSLASSFARYNQLVLIDEIDQQLTYLTGGINAKLDHSRTQMLIFERILDQTDFSLNIFDILRETGAKCVCFSGTLNNLIASKLSSMGYSNEQISIVNVAPIKDLYRGTEIVPLNMRSFDSILPYLSDLEKMPENKKGLFCFSNEKELKSFLAWYKKETGRDCSHIKITSAADGTRLSTPEGILTLRKSRYVIGINMIITGFDLSTHIEGCEFALSVLYRKMSDKISQPLSRNPDHELHHAIAAMIRQFIARQRKGGKCLIPHAYYGIGTLYENLVEIFNTIRDGRNEFAWVGQPRHLQLERHAQGLIQALEQNLKWHKEDRPVVSEIIQDLKLFDGRDFKDECHGETVDPYWIDTILTLWREVYYKRHTTNMTPEEFEKSKHEMIVKSRSTRGPQIQRGGGTKDPREMNTRVIEEVELRSGGICAHCSERIEIDEEEGQICHIKRYDEGGEFTTNNLVRGHKGCDSLYDNEYRFIHKPGGGYYLAKKYYEHQPDMKQWSHISPENILSRWIWTMQKLSATNDLEFETKLIEKGYKLFRVAKI